MANGNGNGKKPLLRNQIADIGKQMSGMQMENKYQNEKLDKIIDKQDKHEDESSIYREQQSTNTEAIKNIKEESLPTMKKLIYGVYGLAGSAVLTIIAIVVKQMFFTK